jgi:tight adherence protein C
LTDDRILLALLAIGLAILLVAGAMVLTLREMAARDLEQRVLSLANGRIDGAALGSPSALGGMHRMLSWIGATVRGRTRLYSDRDLMVLEGMITGTGFNPRTVLPLVLGAKVVLAIGIPLLAVLYARLVGLSGGQQFLTLCVAIPLGLLGPDWALTLLRRPYLAALRRGVPDALDLLVVCTEAGMALENALERVAQEIRHSNPAISAALGKLLDEMRVLPERRDAFRNFAERSGVEGARRVATMLGQSMQYGTPISQALRTVAIDLRRERMVALEAKAVRLPVLLVLPLILFIMPSLFIVLVGPAMLHLMDSLHAAIMAH